jgi:hypothetical protein
MKKILLILLLVSITEVSFSQYGEIGDTGDGRTFLKRVENNLLSNGKIISNGKISRIYNLKSKTDIEKLFFGDINAMVEFFVQPSIEPSFKKPYGFRIMRDSLNVSYIIENKRISDLNVVETVSYPVKKDVFTEKLYSTIKSTIKHFVMKGEPASILDGSTVTFRCVVEDEVWTLTIHEPDREIFQLPNICEQLIADIQSKNVDETKYITLFENILSCNSVYGEIK